MDNNYYRCHAWLIYWFGRANKCENKDCNYDNPKNFEWALLKGFDYEKKRNNYSMLCVSCHRKYDYTDTQRKKISISKKGKEAKNKRKVILNNEIVFDSLTSASNITGINISTISSNIAGRLKKTKLGIWKYAQQS